MSTLDNELSFDRATYGTDAVAGPPCVNCGGPLRERYWTWQGHVMCDGCRERFSETLAASQSAASFGKAALLGSGVALACGVAYAIFVAVTEIQLALVTIGIAFVVAKVIRRASAGISGRRYQVLAVALTYGAATMGYVPGVWSGLKSAATEGATHQVQSTAEGDARTVTAASDAAPSTASAAERPSALGFVLVLGYFVAFTLAAPFLEVAQAPIGLFIVLFGLWEAWKLTRGLPLALDGPFRVAASPPRSASP